MRGLKPACKMPRVKQLQSFGLVVLYLTNLALKYIKGKQDTHAELL